MMKVDGSNESSAKPKKVGKCVLSKSTLPKRCARTTKKKSAKDKLGTKMSCLKNSDRQSFFEIVGRYGTDWKKVARKMAVSTNACKMMWSTIGEDTQNRFLLKVIRRADKKSDALQKLVWEQEQSGLELLI
jgi:FixJ family two-component response regulator